MKKTLILCSILSVLLCSEAKAQVFPVDTIQYKGDISKYINIVVMGDGYTATEQPAFMTAATNLTNYLFTQEPWKSYRNYFNIFAIKVVSAQSGIKHPGTASDCNSASPSVPVSNPNPYFGTTFDAYGIHRLVSVTNGAAAYNVLTTNFPMYDQVLMVANSPYYGGSGGMWPVSTVANESNEIAAHELGHSFANLADEYWAQAAEKPNMTMETNPALVRWKNWMNTNGVGIYQHCCGGNSAQWYRPHNSCKMQLLSQPYCSVCSEQIVETIHSLANPIVQYSPSSGVVSSASQFITFKLSEVIEPLPNTLKRQWKLDGNLIAAATDSVIIDQSSLTNGSHTLEVTVLDTSALVRRDNHPSAHLNTVTWTINKIDAGVELIGSANRFSYTLYPNPAGNVLNIAMQSSTKDQVSLSVFSMEGKLVKDIPQISMPITEPYQLNIETLTPGTYIVRFRRGNAVYSQPFVKN